MQQAAVFAVILFLNGMQIPLSAPAVVEGNTTWVPVRSVCEPLGWQVAWEAATKSTVLKAPNEPTIRFRVNDPKVQIGDQTVTLGAAPREREGVIYVPVSLLRPALHAQLTWDNQNKTLSIEALPAGAPVKAQIAEVVANPPGWLNKLVVITGEYTGWQGDPFAPATRQGPPVTRSDWTLRDATGSIYCTAASELSNSPLSLRPYEDNGRRIAVAGQVRLADAGFPYLEPTIIMPVSDLVGLTCYVTTDRRSYAPGDTVVMTMTVANPSDTPAVFEFPTSQQYDFIVQEAEGKTKVWQWSDGMAFAQALTSRALAAGESYTVTERWTIPAGEQAPVPGLYQVVGRVNQDVCAYPLTIEIRGPS